MWSAGPWAQVGDRRGPATMGHTGGGDRPTLPRPEAAVGPSRGFALVDTPGRGGRKGCPMPCLWARRLTAGGWARRTRPGGSHPRPGCIRPLGVSPNPRKHEGEASIRLGRNKKYENRVKILICALGFIFNCAFLKDAYLAYVYIKDIVKRGREASRRGRSRRSRWP